mgnify:CR=1 FL=1
MPRIRLEGVTKYYRGERKGFPAVKALDLTVDQGEFLFVTGSGGAGKSTLLQLICGQIRASSGAVYLDRLNIARMSRWRHERLRRYFGYVSQLPGLERKKTIGENLITAALPRLTGPMLRDRVAKSLEIVGLPRKTEELYPVQLPLAECRRAELACALINSPPVLVLDELTAQLDEDTIWDLMHILGEINRLGSTVVMATHAKSFVNILRKRVITLVDGRIWGDVSQGRYGDISIK